jgi:Ca2+/Na+ antiporter
MYYIFNTECTDIIELTIVAFWTSTPEAAVSIIASLHGQSGMAIGNVIGSNILCIYGCWLCMLFSALIQKSRNTALNELLFQ